MSLYTWEPPCRSSTTAAGFLSVPACGNSSTNITLSSQLTATGRQGWTITGVTAAQGNILGPQVVVQVGSPRLPKLMYCWGGLAPGSWVLPLNCPALPHNRPFGGRGLGAGACCLGRVGLWCLPATPWWCGVALPPWALCRWLSWPSSQQPGLRGAATGVVPA